MNMPELRFSEFKDIWRNQVLGSIATFLKGKGISKSEIEEDGQLECIRYGELYTHYGEVITEILSKTNVDVKDLVLSESNDVIIPASGETQLDIAKAACVLKSGVALGGDLNIIKTNLNGIFLSYYLNSVRKFDIAKLAQGNSVVHLYSSQLKSLHIYSPTLPEQQKIAAFLTAIDTRIQQLTRKKALLEQYKKGVMQKIFEREIRFRDEEGRAFPEWEVRRLSDVLHEHKMTSNGTEKVFSVSVHKGLINQEDHLGRSFAAASTNHYNLVKPYDVVYTKSPTGDFPLGIFKQSRVSENVIVSPLYGVFTPETPALGYILNEHFSSPVNIHNYLHSIIQKGAKNTINITNKNFLSKALLLPVSKNEQQKIATFLTALDAKIAQVNEQLIHTQAYKKGLLQQMFV